ncbi:hypothetical protein [Blastococcus xanthinilyticus]|uniref:Peptidase S9 n=1 Tax=Blastococcus xanthinilyticus TaxID=1564164 RepID=A0A5S5CYZ1_9ACTN|nr:hypothetical protein [Blastococcus xanthinilyticus]TYP88963.1 hypothetical protein BD833_103119 [Blastococcus xanthinilyticus]
MTTRPTLPPAVAATVSGAATALYYALPDVVPSRLARGWVKAAVVTVSLAASLPGARAAWNQRPEGQEADQDGEGTPGLTTAFRAMPAGKKAVALALPTAVIAGGVGGMLAAERKIYRRGEARAAAGKRLAHTGPALLYGLLAGVLRLVQGPLDSR